MGLLKTALQSPVLAGTMAYLGVSAIESAVVTTKQATTPASGSQPPAPVSPLEFLNNLVNGVRLPFLGVTLGEQQQIGQQVASDLASIFKNLDFSALKLAILIYIASGGNLAGLLQSSSGILGDIFKSAGITEIAGATGA